jgi:hypothetical protein
VHRGQKRRLEGTLLDDPRQRALAISYAENASVAPASPSTRIDSIAHTRSQGSACQAPAARRNAALPGLIA